MILDERVNSNFDQLNDNDIQIAHYVNTHIDVCKNMKIQDLASQTHASNATIHRFTRKLGFDGYSDFKQEIENTFNYLERIDYRLLTHKMHHATTIYLYGTGRAQMNVAEEAQRILLTMHKNIILLHDVHELKMVLNKTIPEDLFFIISLSGETHQLKEVTQLLQLRQKYFISVTTMKENTLAQ